MRIGNDERIILSLLKKYPTLTEKNLQLLYLFLTNKKRDTAKILQSVRIKGLIDDENQVVTEDVQDVLVDIQIEKEILDNLQNLEEFIKLGKTAKSVLFILSKIKKSSLQFLANSLNESPRNIYAIMQRLEEKHLIYSYNSKIYHLNSRGRRFNPRYYVITDLGKIIARIKTDDKVDQQPIEKLLEKTQSEIESMHKTFNTTNT
jgi:DNA-binding PadR family transcriptional regulator